MAKRKPLTGKAKRAALAEGERAWKALQAKRAKRSKASGARLKAWWAKQSAERRHASALKAARTRKRRREEREAKERITGITQSEYLFGKRRHRSLCADWIGWETFDLLLEQAKAFDDAKGYSWVVKVAITQLDDADQLYGEPEIRHISERYVEPALLDRVTYEARTHLEAMVNGQMYGYKATEVLSVCLIMYLGRVKK